MSDECGDDCGWEVIEEDDLPDIKTEEGRDAWIEILSQQDDDTLAENETGWVKCLTVSDDENMVARFIYPDGSEEVFDLIVRRSMALVSQGDESERN